MIDIKNNKIVNVKKLKTITDIRNEILNARSACISIIQKSKQLMDHIYKEMDKKLEEIENECDKEDKYNKA